MSAGQIGQLLLTGLLETLYMTVPSTMISYLVGMPLGILLVITRRGNVLPMPRMNAVLGTAVNFLRSIPFIILLAMLFPLTRLVMGKAIGTRSVIFPLIISAFPYVARMVENSLNEVDAGVIEAAQSMGSTVWQLILKVMLPEAKPSLVNGAAICTVTILGYTAMASAAGGGGLGALSVTKGLNQRNFELMYASGLALVALVQLLTVAGTRVTKKIDHRKR